MSGGSVWNPENIRDVAESIGLGSLSGEVVDHLTRDVEFRIAQILDEALKSMRHSKRTTLFTQDITRALRVLDIEPLYGYESTRALKFGEASIGPGQPLYYLEDEEVDFEKLINAPLPKVPREICFTAHWLAVEGVQPTIPQNPTSADAARTADLLPKGLGANPHLAATAGADNLAVKPLVKHIISKELQLYFEHVCAAALDEHNEPYRVGALSSLRTDPGIHQLIPYFVQFVAEKVTHNLKSLFTLTQTLLMLAALLDNPHLHLEPYIASLVPPVLTCLVGKRLGPGPDTSSDASTTIQETRQQQRGSNLPAHYAVRDLAASLLRVIGRPKHTTGTPTLKPRLARTLLKHLLSTGPGQPLGPCYGALLGLTGIAGVEGVRVLVLPNLGVVDEALREAGPGGAGGGGSGGSIADEDNIMSGSSDAVGNNESATRRAEVDAVVDVVVGALRMVEHEETMGVAERGRLASDVDADVDMTDESVRSRLVEKVGGVVAERVLSTGGAGLVRTVLGLGLGRA